LPKINDMSAKLHNQNNCVLTISVNGGKHRAIIIKPEGEQASIHIEQGDEQVILNRLMMIGREAETSESA